MIKGTGKYVYLADEENGRVETKENDVAYLDVVIG